MTPDDSASVTAEFADLNLKLAVVQVLMYEKGLLTPRFDVHEFAAGLDRDVDLAAEGQAPIPEVLAYFAALPVPRELLVEVDEIYMDGGNEIYLQVAPQWSGEDSVFDIGSYEELALLSNLESVTLMGASDADLEQIRAQGIDADLL